MKRILGILGVMGLILSGCIWGGSGGPATPTAIPKLTATPLATVTATATPRLVLPVPTVPHPLPTVVATLAPPIPTVH